MKTKISRSPGAWQLPAALGLLLSSSLVMGAQPQSTPAQFDMTGTIEKFKLDAPCIAPSATDPSYMNVAAANALACTATMEMNGQTVKLPANTVVTLPASFLTPYELFAFNPLCTGTACTETGLAIQDTKRLPSNTKPATYEASIQGNIVYDVPGVVPAGAPTYVAGLVKITQEDLNSGDGYINFIDYNTGEFFVGGDLGQTNGARLRINDPVGRYGRSTGPAGAGGGDTQDIRFAVDDGNPTIAAETGYPLCIPRVAPPGIDARCPETNRPIGGVTGHVGTFYMPTAFTDQTKTTRLPDPGFAKPATFPPFLANLGDPSEQAPLEVGDFIHYKGTQAEDNFGKYISVHTISANLGIFTTPGTDPAYMTQEVSIVGLGPAAGFAGLQEGRELFKIVGFTTDVTRLVDTGKVQVDPCNGTEAFINITTEYPNGSSLDPTGNAVANIPLGRFRSQFLKGTALGVSMIPATKEIRTQIRGSNPTQDATKANGLLYGQYQAPVSEYIFPENLGFGAVPIVPNNFGTMQFLSLGHGPWDLYDPYGTIFGNANPAPIQSQLAPWPGSPAPAAIGLCAKDATGKLLNAPPVISISDVVVTAGAAVNLNATASFSPGRVALTQWSWTQTAGPNVKPVGVQALSQNNLSFTAPNNAPSVIKFQLTVTDANGMVATKVVTVTVNKANVSDSLTIPAAPTYRLKDGSWTLTVNGTNNTAAVTMQAINDAGTVVLNLQMTQTPGQAVWTFPAPTKFLVSPLPVRPGETLPRLIVQLTSTKGGAIGPVAVVVRP
jgi:hypothetical protein